MFERFSGESGARALVEALKEQFIVAHDVPVAEAMAAVVTLRELVAGESLIVQDGTDNDLHFVLYGAVDVVIKRRTVAWRGAGLHVGEMALLDRRAPRSATVIATQKTVVATVRETDFAALAAKHPELWRRLALELGNRLRERSKFIKEPNLWPTVFIGSSKEALGVAQVLKDGLTAPDIGVRIWAEGIFRASKTTIEDLEVQAESADFAVLVASPDDVGISRGKNNLVPRDNVLLELGLFMGALTRDRTFLLTQTGAPLKLPSDLLGVTTLRYSGGSSPTSVARRLWSTLWRVRASGSPPSVLPDVSEACGEILGRVRSMGPK